MLEIYKRILKTAFPKKPNWKVILAPPLLLWHLIMGLLTWISLILSPAWALLYAGYLYAKGTRLRPLQELESAKQKLLEHQGILGVGITPLKDELISVYDPKYAESSLPETIEGFEVDYRRAEIRHG